MPAGSSVSPNSDSSRQFWPAAGIIAASVAAYLPVLRAGFIGPAGDGTADAVFLSWRGWARIWFHPDAGRHYFPVLRSLLWLEHRMGGGAPLPFHLASLLLHAAAACLLAAVLRRLAVPGAGLAALLFALHPIGVESVAWVAEQINPLSALLSLLAAWAFLRFDEERTPRSYARALGCFGLALLGSSLTATLPAALLVLCWWRRGRLTWWREILPLLPWLALGAGVGLAGLWAEHADRSSQGTAAASLSWLQRTLVAGRAFWFYADKLLWPARLTFNYPRWLPDGSALWQYAFPAGAIALPLLLWRWRETNRAPFAVVLLFLGTLFPVLGFVVLPQFALSFVADRFLYLAGFGLFALAAAALADAWARGSPLVQGASRVLATVLVAGLGFLTWRQASLYHDPVTLDQATLERNPASWWAHTDLAEHLRAAGNLSDAITHLQAAVRLNPAFALAHRQLAATLMAAGRFPEAATEWEETRREEGLSAEGQRQWAESLARAGRPEDALEHYQQALELKSGDAEIEEQIGITLFQLGRAAEAIGPFEAARRARPDDPEAHHHLGNALTAADRLPEAIQEYEEAVRLRPDYLEAHFNLGLVLLQLGKSEDARAQFAEVLRINPDYRPARAALERLSGPPPG